MLSELPREETPEAKKNHTIWNYFLNYALDKRHLLNHDGGGGHYSFMEELVIYYPEKE